MKIGVDLGGTNLRVGLIDNSEIVNLISEPCLSSGTEQEVVDHIISLIERVITPEVSSIGVGVPSVVDSELGIVYNVTNIPSWKEVHLKEILEAHFKLPVGVNNDCNCFALGISRMPYAVEHKNLVCITLGTGVGAGIMINGELYSGKDMGAGEIGGVQYLQHDYEFYCSSRLFIDKGTTGVEAYNKAMQGDAQALEIWAEVGSHVGQLVMMVLYTYAPDMIVFGGSIAKAYDLFAPAMHEELKQFAYPKAVETLKIHNSTEENIGVVGASLCVK